MSDQMLIIPDPDGVDPQAMAARRRQKSRRRAALWGAFLLLGLALGTIYATGFATLGGATGSASDSPANTNTPGASQDTSDLANVIDEAATPLDYVWNGRWGSISPTKVMYSVDLTTLPVSDSFYSEVLLTNNPTKFSDLQLQLRIGEAAGATCQDSDLTRADGTSGGGEAGNQRVMIFDTQDAQVTFDGIQTSGASIPNGGFPGGELYCIGIVDYSGSGKDVNGTFIRKFENGTAFTGNYPALTATVNRRP